MRIDLFITENLQKEPKKLGYAQDVARMAAEYGLKHYYRASEATRKERYSMIAWLKLKKMPNIFQG